jgi:hypothetical protein
MLLLYRAHDTIATITRQTKIGESGAVVALVVERAADGAAGVHATAYISMVRYGSGRLYGADRTFGRYEHRYGNEQRKSGLSRHRPEHRGRPAGPSAAALYTAGYDIDPTDGGRDLHRHDLS